jgi:hypothetical protein
MYDIIYIKKNDDDLKFNQLKKKFPFLKTIDCCENYFETYQLAQKKAMSKMFWIFDSDINLLDTCNFDYKVSEWDVNYIHVFRYGVYLIPRNYKFTKEEIKYGFFNSKKDVGTIVSLPPYEAVFISYNEPNADENYELVKLKLPDVKRIKGVKGIHQAHKAAAKLVATPMFWVIDGDARIVDNFDFREKIPRSQETIVHTWKSINPINDLEYGYGGVKLLPTLLTANLDINSVDMTTSISNKFKSVQEISNITVFNTDPFNTWKSAFRECVKLSSKIINNQNDIQTLNRLEIWCSKGQDRPFGNFALLGAQAGRKYGTENAGNREMLKKINDWKWLQREFKNY